MLRPVSQWVDEAEAAPYSYSFLGSVVRPFFFKRVMCALIDRLLTAQPAADCHDCFGRKGQQQQQSFSSLSAFYYILLRVGYRSFFLLRKETQSQSYSSCVKEEEKKNILFFFLPGFDVVHFRRRRRSGFLKGFAQTHT